MIIIDRAIYKNENEEKIINAYDISQEDYQNIYKGHLYCIEPGCNAELVHMDVQKNGMRRYFRTLQESKHKENCPYEVIKVGLSSRRGTILGAIDVTLTEGHIKDILNQTFKVATGQKKRIPVKGKIKKPNKSAVITTKDNTEENLKVNPIAGGVSGDGKGGKQPYIYKKPASALDKNKIGETLSVYGQVKEVSILEDKAFITIVEKNKPIKIYFGNPFRDNHTQEFKYLKFFKEYHEKLCALGKPVTCVAICFIRELYNEVVGEIMDYHNIEFNNTGLYGIRYLLEKGKY